MAFFKSLTQHDIVSETELSQFFLKQAGCINKGSVQDYARWQQITGSTALENFTEFPFIAQVRDHSTSNMTANGDVIII